MAFRPIEKFADITPVVASGKASASLPAFGVYHAIHLVCTDGGTAVSASNIANNLTNVKITLNGRTAFEASAEAIQLLYEAQYFKKADVAPIAGVLTIPLSPDHLTNMNIANRLGWGMQDVGTMQLELTFSASVGTTGHTDAIAVYVERTQPSANLGAHRELQRVERNFTGSGDQEITDIPFTRDEKTAGLHLMYNGVSATINTVELLLNNDTIQTYEPLIQRAVLEKRGRKEMVTGAGTSLFQIPFDLTDDDTGYLDHNILEDLRLRVNWSAAPGAFTILREIYKGSNNG